MKTSRGADSLSKYDRHSKERSLQRIKRPEHFKTAACLPFCHASEPLHQDIDRQIHNEEGVRYVCQQEWIKALCLEVLDKEGCQDLQSQDACRDGVSYETLQKGLWL